MTATNNYILIAKEITSDSLDNMVSIIKIIEKFTFGLDLDQLSIRSGQQVFLPINFAIGTSWSFDKVLLRDTLLSVKTYIVDPDGKRIQGPDQESFIPKGLIKVNFNFNHQGLPITKAGKYTLHAELVLANSNKKIAEAKYPYEVELINARPTVA